MSPSPHDVDDRRAPAGAHLGPDRRRSVPGLGPPGGRRGGRMRRYSLAMATTPFQITDAYQPTGDQPQAIAELGAGLARGDRFQTLLGVTGSGKTFTMAQVIAQVRAPGAGDRPQQDPGRAALQRVPRAAARGGRRVLRQLLRLLPARGLHRGHGHLHREGLVDQRRDRPPAPRGHRRPAGAPRRRDRRLGQLHLRPRIGGDLPRPRARPDRRRGDTRARRSSAGWWRPSTSATTRCSSAAASACGATRSRCSRPTPRPRTASRCSATRWRASPSTTRSPARSTASLQAPGDLPGDALHHPARDDRPGDPRDPRRARGAAARASRPRASWSRPTACASAPSTTWR